MNHMSAAPLTASPDEHGPSLPSRAMRYYVLGILVLTGSISIIDRQVMTILIEPIRKDFGLSDSQMGLVSGIAFALVYTTLCIPAARLADRWSRPKLIACAVTFWSVATLCCGLAQNAVQLFFARFGVGLGEAGGNPASHALIGDLFPRQERATAMAVLLLASPIGMGLGLAAGGLILQDHGWRTTFLVAGIPGLLLGPLVWLTFPKVRRGAADGLLTDRGNEPAGTILPLLWRTAALRNMVFGASIHTIIAMGLTTWVPAFLERSYGMSHAAIGAGLGAALGLGSLTGHLAGGPLVDWLGRRDLRWHLWVPTVSAPLSAAVAALAFVSPPGFVFPLMGLQMFLSGLFAGPMIAICMNLAPVSARATASACLVFAFNLVGMGIGPQVVGVLSDALKPQFGAESLRIALLVGCLLGAPATWFFWRASRTYRDDLTRVDARNAGAA